jgi:tetratricopeptide (TPR) repeat protein
MASIDLDELGAGEAVALLCSICPRLNMEDAQALAQACGHLPLALRISGSILHNDPALSVTSYLARLADSRQRLSQLRDPDDPQLDVEASLALSYIQLDAATQQVFRQLGIFVTDFTSSLAQAVIEAVEGVDIETTLRLLLRRNLIMYDGERDRWRLHDLLRDLARRELESTSAWEPTMWHYARAAIAIAAQTQDQYLAGDEKTLLMHSQFDTERAHIDAARRWAQQVAETPDGDQLLIDAALASRYIEALRYDPRYEIIPLWERVRTATQRMGDHRNEGIALNNLGSAYYGLGELLKAISYYEQALPIARELGDRRGEGAILGNLGIAYYSLGKPLKAISYYKQRLTIACERDDRYGECYALTNLGNAYTELGDTRHAIDACEKASIITQAIGNRQMEGYALSYLARARAIQGDAAQASITYTQAVTLLQDVGDHWGEAECNWLFGVALVQEGERDQALPLLRAAVAYQQEIGHAKAAEHAALVARLERGEELPPELHIPKAQRTIGGDPDEPTDDDV